MTDPKIQLSPREQRVMPGFVKQYERGYKEDGQQYLPAQIG